MGSNITRQIMSCNKIRPEFHHRVVARVFFLRCSDLCIYIQKSWSRNSGKTSIATSSTHPSGFCSICRCTECLKLVISIIKQINSLISLVHYTGIEDTKSQSKRLNLTFIPYKLLQSDNTSPFPNPRRISDPEGCEESGE